MSCELLYDIFLLGNVGLTEVEQYFSEGFIFGI